METRSQKNTKTNTTSELSGANKFLCRIAGSDLTILAHCPHEISRHARIGAIIISTALLAFVSMFFAIQTVSKSTLTGLIAGLIWGIVIFILDSYIVASYKKNDKKWKEFKVAIPRLLLALVLGCSISIPLELKVFENEISEKIKIIEIEEFSAQVAQANAAYNSIKKPYEDERNLKNIENTDLNNQLEPFKQKVTRLEMELADEIGGRGRTGKLSYGPVAKQIDDQLKKARIEFTNKIDEIAPIKFRNQNRIIELDSIIRSIPKPIIPIVELFGISAQLDGLKRLINSNNYVLLAYWVFFLLVIGIETAPIFVKFFTPKGSYDEILAMNEYVVFMEQQKRKSDLHEMINSEIEAIRSLNERKKTAQDTVNERLMTEIANAQGEIAEKAIKLWKERQLRSVEQNPTSFVSSNEERNDNGHLLPVSSITNENNITP
ncbi:MAG: DUF4407 domain-containing protein [Arcticibacter sp.]